MEGERMTMRRFTQVFFILMGAIGTAQAQMQPSAAAAGSEPAPVPGEPATQNPNPVYVPAEGAPPTQVAAPAEVQPLPAQVYYPAPTAPEEPKPGARLHDGFYLRMSFGLGSGTATEDITAPGADYPEIKFSGLTTMFDILIGGSPVPGFVLGGGLVGHSIMNPTVKADGVEYDTDDDVSLNLSTLGLFTAIYPDPRSGFNIHGLVGYGVISASNGTSRSTNNPSGFSLMGGVGYDFWVGDQWSLGPDLRLAYAKTSWGGGSGEEDKVSMLVPTLSFTATYH